MGMKDWKIWMRAERNEVAGEVTMARDDFTNVVMAAFANVDAPLKATLKDWCSTAQHVAWGTFLGRTEASGPCNCPLASVAEVIDPEYDMTMQARNPIEEDENVLHAAKGAYTKYDMTMQDRTGYNSGVITITD